MHATPVSRLLYLHGFRSSPRSTKARMMQAWLAERHPRVHWHCPQLPPSPREAAALIAAITREWQPLDSAVVGSSLGGFYATWLAEGLGCRAVLLNPAVHPARDLGRYVGEHAAWHDPAERFVFEPGYVDELRALARGPLARPGHYLAIIAKGDEVLDWSEMTARYPGARQIVLEGGDHALTGFEAHLPAIGRFLALRPD
jgi:predicted esterase YcpF (UPF0227 family)